MSLLWGTLPQASRTKTNVLNVSKALYGVEMPGGSLKLTSEEHIIALLLLGLLRPIIHLKSRVLDGIRNRRNPRGPATLSKGAPEKEPLYRLGLLAKPGQKTSCLTAPAPLRMAGAKRGAEVTGDNVLGLGTQTTSRGITYDIDEGSLGTLMQGSTRPPGVRTYPINITIGSSCFRPEEVFDSSLKGLSFVSFRSTLSFSFGKDLLFSFGGMPWRKRNGKVDELELSSSSRSLRVQRLPSWW
ncbi:hypothetical protein Cgig2_009655 [Carnegiea gigantea]|uniref:Uncharacterized protein n=1 Tax=Carnegiea gigantea TaxID=171969 RepID=A0A9Q1QBB6_9CARY|nr:hypothetical protein Cgig2_009655 [Carnegiea gigantea]